MSSVDDRIVNMQFNNKQFTTGAAESLKSMDAVENKVASMGKSKGMSQLGSSVDTVKGKFSALQVAGVTAIATVSNKVVNAGLNMLKSFTIQPILDGFSEYQTNLNSVQTVMANTGASVKQVNKALNQLNHYSDLTIYNFSEMARNVGTFTAAGVDLKTSVSAIQGIANIAALSGSSSQQASTAMYQLSQAIAAGRVNLQDWNSVVNAGMGGKKLQTALAQTAIAMGKISDKAVQLGKGSAALKINGEAFRQSISAVGGDSWLSSDVLVKTLAAMDGRFSRVYYESQRTKDGLRKYTKQSEITAQIEKARVELAKQGVKYSDEQFKSIEKMANASVSAATTVKTLPQLINVVQESLGSIWSNAFSGILGNFVQSKNLWTAVGNVIQTQTQKLNNSFSLLLTGWARAGGRVDVIRGFKHIFFDLGKVMGSVKEAFRDVFPADASNTLVKLSDAFRKFTLALVGHKKTWDDLRDIFGGIFAVFHIGLSITIAITKGIIAFFSAVFQGGKQGSGSMLDIVAAIGRVLKAVDRAITSGGILTDVFVTIGKVAGTAVGFVVKMVGYLVTGIAALVKGQGIGAFASAFGSAKDDLAGFANTLSSIGGPFKAVLGFFSKMHVSVNGIGDAISNVVAKAASMGGVVGALARALGPIGGMLKGFSGKALDLGKQGAQIAEGIVGGLLQGLVGSDIAGKIKDFANGIVTWIKDALGIHSPATSLIPVGFNIAAGIAVGIVNGIATIIKAVATAISGLFSGMDGMDFASFFNAIMTGVVLITIQRFVSTLTSIAKPVESVMSGVRGALSQATDTLKTMQSAVKYKALLQIAIAVGLLTASLIALSFINPKKLAVGLGAISLMISELVGAMAALVKIDGKGSLALVATAMVQMAVAIDLLAVAIAALGALPLKTLEKGMGAVALMLAVLVKGMSSLAKNVEGVPVAAAAMISMAVAINLLVVAVAALGNMDMGTLAKGIGSIALLIGILVGAMESIGAISKEAPVAAAAMISMAVAIDLLAAAVLVFGKMSVGSLVKGGVMIAAMVTVLVVAMEALGTTGPLAAAGAAGMLLIATAVNLLIPALLALSLVPWDTFLKGLAMLTLLAVPLGVIGAVAEATAVGLLALGAAIALAGLGFLAFGKGFALVAATGVAGVAVITAAVTAFLALIPSIVASFANAFVALVQVLANASPKLRKAFGTIFKNMLGVITDSIPEITKLTLALLNALYRVLRSYIPKVVKLFTLLISSGLDAIKKLSPKIVDTGISILEDLLDGIDKHISKIIDKGTNIIVKFIKGIGNAGIKITNAAGDTVVKFINDLSDAIDKHSADLRAAGLKLIGSVFNAATGGLAGKFASLGHSLGSGLGALKNKLTGRAIRAGHDIGSSIAAGITKALIHNVGLAKAIGVNIQGGILAVAKEGAPLTDAQKAQNVQIRRARAAVYAANAAQEAADRKKVDAQAAKAEAKRIEKENNKKLKNKHLTPAQKKAIKKSSNEAAKASAKADAAATKAQKVADAKANAVQDAQAFRDADAAGRGDIDAAKAVTAANNARDALARSQEEFKQAQKFKDTNRKLYDQLIKDAKAKAKAAQNYADQAKHYQTEAQGYYAQSIKDQADALEKQVTDQQAAADWQAKFDAADTATQAQMYKTRADQENSDAAAAKANYEKYLQLARDTASTDAALAQSYLDQASSYADQAQNQADAAKQDVAAAEQLLNQGTTTTDSGGSVISPSASVLANAAKAIDDYTQSMKQSVEAAKADQGPTQFVQNNYSPTQLDSATIYRQGKNLVAAASSKLGTN